MVIVVEAAKGRLSSASGTTRCRGERESVRGQRFGEFAAMCRVKKTKKTP
jgi:hypothetical protein